MNRTKKKQSRTCNFGYLACKDDDMSGSMDSNLQREELSALKKALKIPGMQSHINRKTAAWRLIHKRDGLKGIYNPTREVIYEWVKGKVASILYSGLHQKSLEELYEMYACGMTAGETNFLSLGKSQLIIDLAKEQGIKMVSWKEDRQPLGDLKGLPKRKATKSTTHE